MVSYISKIQISQETGPQVFPLAVVKQALLVFKALLETLGLLE
jgi:hypothetical protein